MFSSLFFIKFLQISCDSINDFASAYKLLTLVFNKLNSKRCILQTTKLAVVELTKLHMCLEKYKNRREGWKDQY